MELNNKNIFELMTQAKELLEQNSVPQNKVGEELAKAFMKARPKLMKNKKYKHLLN